MQTSLTRRALALCLFATAAFGATAADYPARAIELVVAAGAGGGTDVMARAFADAARRHLPQPIVVVNKPGAASAIGFADVANARPDGYKLGIVSVNLVILPSLQLMKQTSDDFTPIARLNFDPSAITVRADAPWQTIEEFIADAKKRQGALQVGNAGVGDIWHVAAASLEERIGTRFNHVPFQGAAPAIVSLLGGHIDAVAVSPGEVVQHVIAGRLRTLAVMSDERLGGPFAKVPTLKEKQIDLAIGVWRGLAAPKGVPPDVVEVLRKAARATSDDPVFRESLSRANMGEAYLDAPAFKLAMEADRITLRSTLARLVIQK